jgi:Fe-S cluster assembly iron-binding protein IscA
MTMLVLTENARSVIVALVDRLPQPDSSGLRIAETGTGDQTGFEIGPAAGPSDGDQLVEAEGARVFLEPAAATALSECVLDAQVDDDGHYQFLVARQ